MGGLVTLFLLLLLFFTYAYHLALAVVVVAIILFGFWLSNHYAQSVTSFIFDLNSRGICSFKGDNYYQLQENSRFSFLGCWLILEPISVANSMLNNKNEGRKITLFIYRDSLSQQDFSRLCNVISQLNHQS
jgi:hypothetical protein